MIEAGAERFRGLLSGRGERSTSIIIFSLRGKSSATCGKWGFKCLRRTLAVVFGENGREN